MNRPSKISIIVYRSSCFINVDLSEDVLEYANISHRGSINFQFGVFSVNVLCELINNDEQGFFRVARNNV